MDHVTPKRAGGSNDPDKNIEVLCRYCNLIKGDSLATRPQLWMLKRHMQLRKGGKKKMFEKIINMGVVLYGPRIYF
jgi:5-methylcytosine-specific restriction endonuclease McrA